LHIINWWIIVLEIFKNYLRGEEYYLIIYSNYIYIYNYKDINKFTDTFISLKLEKMTVNIYGNNLLITKLEKTELLIKGSILKVEKIYE